LPVGGILTNLSSLLQGILKGEVSLHS